MRVEPNSNALVVYDAVNHVLDDSDTGVFTSFAVDKIVTIGRLWASEWRISVERIRANNEKSAFLRCADGDASCFHSK